MSSTATLLGRFPSPPMSSSTILTKKRVEFSDNLSATTDRHCSIPIPNGAPADGDGDNEEGDNCHLLSSHGDPTTPQRDICPSPPATLKSGSPYDGRSSNSSNTIITPSAASQSQSNEQFHQPVTPNSIVFTKIEQIMEKMQDEATGVPVRTVKSLLTKIPSVFTGADIIQWMLKNLNVTDLNEVLHLAHLLACYGYIFPIDDHVLTVKNDGTYYRFQTPYYWPSNTSDPENTDYAVYLCKRTMQNKARLELVDYEAENLARLQKMFSRKWEFIYMQAEAQAKVDKKRDKLERKVLDSQERAFWDVYRPVPGSINIMEADIKKSCRSLRPQAVKYTNLKKFKTPDELKEEIQNIQRKLNRGLAKISKITEFFMNYYEQYAEHDPFLTAPEPSNPWITDNTEYWESYSSCASIRDLPIRRIKKWTFSLKELLKDPAGREQFTKFLEKEYSGENLKFYEEWKKLKSVPAKQVPEMVQQIYEDFFSPNAQYTLNIDCKSENLTKENMKTPNRNTFDQAAEHIYQLMKSDSYNRFIRSDFFREILASSKKRGGLQQSKSLLPKISSLNKTSTALSAS